MDAAAVASVSSSGLVTAIAAGTATVTATSEGKSGSATITVLRPVGSVTLDRATATLVPAQTLQLAATPKADNGDSLTGRTLAWSSSTVAVATVNATGLVTAVTPGSSTITVTAEGKSATAAITVTSGGLVVANAPTTISNPDSSVRIEVPVGAAPPGLAITIVPTTTAPATALPARTWRMGPRLYEFGPNGTQFSAPVRVTLKYNPAELPAWVVPSDLGIQRWNGTAWNGLSNITIDTARRTISGTTTGFSTFTLTAGLPPAALTPQPAQVNYNQRSVSFVASVPGHVANAFQYRWVTTGANGVLGVNFSGNQQQYIASTPIIPEGTVDLVGVEVSAQQVPGGPFTPIANTQVPVTSDLGLTYELNPWSQLADFGQQKTVQALVRNRDGSIYTSPDLFYDYSATKFAGNTTPAPGQTQNSTATYQALPIQQQLKKAPRVDQITVTFLIRERVVGGDLFTGTQVSYNFKTMGTADAFVEVGKDVYVGRFAVETQITNNQGGGCVYAYLYAPVVTPAPKSYALKAYGFNDTALYGTSYTKNWTAATGTGFTDVQQVGSEWRMGLDGGCTPTSSGITFRQGLYASRFAGIQAEIKVTP